MGDVRPQLNSKVWWFISPERFLCLDSSVNRLEQVALSGGWLNSKYRDDKANSESEFT